MELFFRLKVRPTMLRIANSLIASLFLMAFLASARGESPAPPYERVLKGEDAEHAAQLIKRGDELMAVGDYAGVIRLAEELLALRTKVQGADHHQTANQRADLVCIRKVVALDEEGRRGWRTAIQNYNEARRLIAKARYAEALPITRSVLEIHQRVLGEDHRDTAYCYKFVAENLKELGKFDEAEPLFRKALEIYRRVLGEDHPDTANSYNSVAMMMNAMGKADEAAPLLLKVLETHRRVQGEDHSDTAQSYNNLAYNLLAQGKFVEALPLFQKALEIRRRVLGEYHADTANSYHNVALTLDELGKVAEAEPYYRKALDLSRLVLGQDHPDTSNSYRKLAKYLQAQGKAAEAQPLFQKALEINLQILGENHEDIAVSYNYLASNLETQGKAAESQPLLEKALEIRRRVLGEYHSDTATSYNNLAISLMIQGRVDEALPLYQKALELRRQGLGEDHAKTADSYNNVAFILMVQDRVAEALPLFQKALEINRRVHGENHATTASSYKNLATALHAQGKAAEALPLWQKALEICQRLLGEEHPGTASSYSNLGKYLEHQGNLAEAQPLHQKALEINRRVLGEDHTETADSYANVAMNLIAQGKAAEAEPILRRAIIPYETSRLTRAIGPTFERSTNPRHPLALLQKAHEPFQAWDELERTLARGLLYQQIGVTQNFKPAEVDGWKRELDRLVGLKSQILTLVTKANRSDEDTARLDSLLKGRLEVEKRLAALGKVAGTRDVASGDAIRSALPPQAALLYWVDVANSVCGVQEHWACLVRPTGDPKWERLPGSGPDKKWSKDDATLPKKLRAALASSTSQGEVESLAKQLYVQRMEPIVQHLAGVETLYVVPVDEMAGIPVEALINDYAIRYVPSGTFLARLKERAKPTGNNLLAVADPIFTDPAEKPKASDSLPPGGLLVLSVDAGGQADRAGLKRGDVLLKYGDTELTDNDKFREAIAANVTAKSIPLTVWRQGAEKPFVRDLVPGKLGIGVHRDPALVVIADRLKADEMLLAIRGGDWGDLPGTRGEATRIGKLFGEQAMVLADSSASEQKLEALRRAGELKKYRYLHFATHGEGNNVRAFESSLILAQDTLPKDPFPKAFEPFTNGQLSASEVLEFWKLDAELVTLSACETAVGSQGGGDGLLGFAQAFLTAGSRAVCLSLWKVDDTATTLLMDRFYQNLLGKRPVLEKPLGKAAALAEAKNWLRNLSSDEALQLTADMTKGVVRGKGRKALPVTTLPQPDDPAAAKTFKPFDHPKYWAAFILIGDPD